MKIKLTYQNQTRETDSLKDAIGEFQSNPELTEVEIFYGKESFTLKVNSTRNLSLCDTQGEFYSRPKPSKDQNQETGEKKWWYWERFADSRSESFQTLTVEESREQLIQTLQKEGRNREEVEEEIDSDWDQMTCLECGQQNFDHTANCSAWKEELWDWSKRDLIEELISIREDEE